MGKIVLDKDRESVGKKIDRMLNQALKDNALNKQRKGGAKNGKRK